MKFLYLTLLLLLPSACKAQPYPLINFAVAALANITSPGGVTGHAVIWNGSAWVTGVPGYTNTYAAATTWTVNHNLNSLYVKAWVYNGSNRLVRVQVDKLSVNRILVTFPIATAGRVVVK